MIAEYDSEEHDAAGRADDGRSESHPPSTNQADVTLTRAEAQLMMECVGQAYVVMESAERFVREQDRATGGIALSAALSVARNALAAVLARLLASWAGSAALWL